MARPFIPSSLRLSWRLSAALLLGAAPLCVAAAPVVEFYNSQLDNYFITANAVEAAAVDSGAAGPGWTRTGDSFNAGGLSPVCRFYGSISPGPNSHFYTVDPAECETLKQLQAVTPATQKRWNFESLDFITTAPDNGACPADTVPVYRAYNNGNARGVDSNHRITTSQAGIAEVVARGWVSEGVVLCGATAASVAATAQFWQQAAGVWYSGSAPSLQMLRFDAAGGYLMGTTQGAGGDPEHPGVERGAVVYDAPTRRFAATVAQDTNGDGGFFGRDAVAQRQTIAIEGTALVVRDVAGAVVTRLFRIPNEQDTIVGAWTLAGDTSIGAPHYVFLPDGRVMTVDTQGDATTPAHASCGGPGVELGTYAWNGGTGTLTITSMVVDTDGCAGLNTPPDATTVFSNGQHTLSGFVLSPDGNTLSLFGVVFRRVQ